MIEMLESLLESVREKKDEVLVEPHSTALSIVRSPNWVE